MGLDIKYWALHIRGTILLVLWDGQDAHPLYFRALVSPTLQESSLDSATPNIDIGNTR
ncbi:MAG: hypothetical protein V7K71_16100 [Nostoc sp.]|uniref:hypothetical protein n=1 Tax=Nostoc sp. TaxID=1180 RepID=UPI002FF4C7A3